MELLPHLETLSLWLHSYGSLALFVLLAMGIIALPVPEESLMVLAGILMSQGTLNIPSTIAAATLGSITGISVSYLVGKTAGYYVFHRYGAWIGLTEERLEKAHQWFKKFGKWALFIGYFIPGVRHFTGLSAGASNLEYHLFALFAYMGACVWVALFLSVGYFFGNYGLSYMENLDIENLEIGLDEAIFAGLVLLAACLLLFTLRKNKSKM